MLVAASFIILLVSVSFYIYIKRLHHSLSYIQAVEQHVREGRLDDAIVILKNTLSKNPQNAEAHFALGIINNKKDLLDDALVELETALKINPGLVSIYQELYLVYKKKGLESEAKNALDAYERLKGSK
jgi:tetratricopeptide (TPR) repeat protein